MKIPVDIQIDFLWGEQHFKKDDWGPITYIVGANGTGMSLHRIPFLRGFYYNNEQPLIFLNFLSFTISAKLPKSRTKPGKPCSTRLSGLRLH